MTLNQQGNRVQATCFPLTIFPCQTQKTVTCCKRLHYSTHALALNGANEEIATSDIGVLSWSPKSHIWYLWFVMSLQHCVQVVCLTTECGGSNGV